MQAKTYLGKITVRIDEYENDVSLLVVANSRDSAWGVLEGTARDYYGSPDTPEEDGGYYANGGEIFVSAKGLEEIGLATFLELKPCFMVRRQANVVQPDETAFEAPLSEMAQAFTQALNRKEKVVSHSQVLNALASAYGHNNWHVLKNKLAALEPQTEISKKPSEPVDAEYRAWVVQEVQRVGAAQVRFIEEKGYVIRENGSGSCWYAVKPGATSNEDRDYLGFFATLDDLVEQLLEKLDYLPDEVALGLCMTCGLSVLPHTEPTPGSRWFNLVSEGAFETAGDAARAALSMSGISTTLTGCRMTKSVEFTRRKVADAMFGTHEYDAVVKTTAWDARGDRMERALFLREDDGSTRKIVFCVTFKPNSAEPDGWSVQ
jgi:hypothetical protein